MTIETKFDNGEIVKTHLGDRGIVAGFWIDDNNNLKVNVDLPGGESAWFKESQLILQEDEG